MSITLSPCEERVFVTEYAITERMHLKDIPESQLKQIIDVLKITCSCADNSCYKTIEEMVDNFPPKLDKAILRYYGLCY